MRVDSQGNGQVVALLQVGRSASFELTDPSLREPDPLRKLGLRETRGLAGVAEAIGEVIGGLHVRGYPLCGLG